MEDEIVLNARSILQEWSVAELFLELLDIATYVPFERLVILVEHVVVHAHEIVLLIIILGVGSAEINIINLLRQV